MTTVILGLGSNVGDRAGYLRQAVEALRPLLAGMRASSIYQAQALLPEGAPSGWDRPFLNMAVAGVCKLSPEHFIQALKAIERGLGRQNRGRWSPREIDIDILAMGDTVLNSPELSIPHSELLKRDFALLPLAELYPQWVVPAGEHKGKTAAALVKFCGYRLNDSFGCYRKKTRLVGITNITPDSFSDGGKYHTPDKALAHIEALIAAGVDAIDIGAESTRPGAKPLSPDEEWERLEPVLSQLPGGALYSVDTRHAATAKKALARGVHWVNDVSGFSDPDMIDAVKNADCQLVVMHSLSVPADKSITLPANTDVIDTLIRWGRQRIETLWQAGIDKERVIFDPGVGFGKTAEQSWQIVQGAATFSVLGVPILIGHSRKSFLAHKSLPSLRGEVRRGGEIRSNLTVDHPPPQPSPSRGEGLDMATLAASQSLIEQGVDYLRVHDVAAHGPLCEQALYG